MLSSTAAPREILQKILLFSMGDTLAGPPHEFANLMLTCRSLYQKLNTPEVYTMILGQKFDIDKPLRCLGIEAVRHNARHELQRRFIALSCFRRLDINHASLTEAFWVAYSMLEDSHPEGKNFRQILWAGLARFLDSYLRHHLYDDSASHNGWPLANERNSLAVALAWVVTSSVVVTYERAESQSRMLKLLAPYVFAAFRYPISRIPEHSFHNNNVVASQWDSCDLQSLPFACSTRPYFGKIRRTTPIPSASLFATLLYFARHETIPLLIPPHILKNRAEADALGRMGPTLDDVNDFILNCRTLFPSLSQVSQILRSYPFPYQPGSATGSWRGSCIIPFDAAYRQWSMEPCVPSHFETTGRRPLYINMKEYICYDNESIIPKDTEENGMLNAWLPPDLAYVEHGNGVEVSDPQGTFKTVYESCRDGPTKRQKPVVDVIIIGKTDERQSAAWGSFRVRGRVRLSDGLVVLLWTSLDGLEPTLFSGYLPSPQNFVGRQKPRLTGVAPCGWEAPFSLSKDNTPVLYAHL